MASSLREVVFFGDGLDFGCSEDGGLQTSLFQVHPQHFLLPLRPALT